MKARGVRAIIWQLFFFTIPDGHCPTIHAFQFFLISTLIDNCSGNWDMFRLHYFEWAKLDLNDACKNGVEFSIKFWQN